MTKPNSSSSMEHLFSHLRKYKLLTKKEEVKLATKLRTGTRKEKKHARNIMINSNLRLAISIAKKCHHKNPNIDFDDLIQESTIGLMKAVERFNPDMGNRFSTYAYHWIKQSLREHVTSFQRQISLPNNINHVLFKADKFKNDFIEKNGIQPTTKTISKDLNMREKTLNSIWHCTKPAISLNAPVKSSKNFDSGRTFMELISDTEWLDTTFERKKIIEIIRKTLPSLTTKEEQIIRLRFGIFENPEDHTTYPITEKEVRKMLREKAAESRAERKRKRELKKSKD